MCGRFDRHSELARLAELVEGLELACEVAPSYNIAPSQTAAVIVANDGGRRLEALSWGLVPSWSNKPSLRRPINARLETVTEKPMFRGAIARGRCLVPCDGYYEWAVGEAGKQPYYFHRRDGRPLLLAGIQEVNNRLAPEPIHSFCVLTRAASDAVAAIHHRMPVMLDVDAVDSWLDASLGGADARAFAEAVAEDEIAAYPVSTFVNTPANNSPRCIEETA